MVTINLISGTQKKVEDLSSAAEETITSLREEVVRLQMDCAALHELASLIHGAIIQHGSDAELENAYGRITEERARFHLGMRELHDLLLEIERMDANDVSIRLDEITHSVGYVRTYYRIPEYIKSMVFMTRGVQALMGAIGGFLGVPYRDPDATPFDQMANVLDTILS